MTATMRVTTVNHASVEIARPADLVWREIVDLYVDGAKFSTMGYVLEPLHDDPAAFLGGYRMTLRAADGSVADDRLCYITERDETARRLSLYADYRVPADWALIVHASYHAIPIARGARFELHSYSTFTQPRPAGDARAETAKLVADFRAHAATHLDAFLQGVRDTLEARPA